MLLCQAKGLAHRVHLNDYWFFKIHPGVAVVIVVANAFVCAVASVFIDVVNFVQASHVVKLSGKRSG